MKLTEHFSLEEFTRSDLAVRKGILNEPNEQQIDNLRKLATAMEQVRLLLNAPIHITSGFRCSALNKAVGSKPNSKHTEGLACDFVVTGMTPPEVCRAIADADIVFDQLICEFYNPATGNGWTHFGLAAKPRQAVLTINQHGTFSGIHV